MSPPKMSSKFVNTFVVILADRQTNTLRQGKTITSLAVAIKVLNALFDVLSVAKQQSYH